MKFTDEQVDLVVVGAGPVGLLCAYLARLSGLSTVVLDKSAGPLEVGRADALNARTLQLLQVAGLFEELYPLGKRCSTSSVWANGKFLARDSSWWEALEGCSHKHFLMLGQAFLERALDAKLTARGAGVRRGALVEGLRADDDGCVATLAGGEEIRSRYLIGADGARSFVRERCRIPFVLERPELVWAVIDGVVETDFPKVPEIIVFQAESSDVAWIPREGNIDRFYVRMDTKEFTHADALAKINRAMYPHALNFKEVVWSSQFSVKESVAEKFSFRSRVFLAGDACHIHSVNGGQGLNTGVGDAFNLIWKLAMKIRFGAPASLLSSYESERKPVALSVVETSGELVRATKYSANGTHAKDYLEIVKRRAGNITGMGIRYGVAGLAGTRLFDFEVEADGRKTRIYALLDYSRYTLLLFGPAEGSFAVPPFVTVREIPRSGAALPYEGRAVLVRPDAYIEATGPLAEAAALLNNLCFG